MIDTSTNQKIYEKMDKIATLCEVAMIELESCNDKLLKDENERKSVYKSAIEYFNEINKEIDEAEAICGGDAEVMSYLNNMREVFDVEELKSGLASIG